MARSNDTRGGTPAQGSTRAIHLAWRKVLSLGAAAAQSDRDRAIAAYHLARRDRDLAMGIAWSADDNAILDRMLAEVGHSGPSNVPEGGGA